MRKNIDYVRIPLKGSPDYYYVVNPRDEQYDVYLVSVGNYPQDVVIYLNRIDLTQYSEQVINDCLAAWGHKCVEDFEESLTQNDPDLINHKLALAYCLTEVLELEKEWEMEGEMDRGIDLEIVFSGSVEEAEDFIENIIGEPVS
ncbi:MAG: hypothetical protein ACOX0E_02670 [Syntrophomonadaceae bacterium]|jgi:hypothetical protein